MKISLKLSREIHKKIDDQFWKTMCLVEEKFRTDKISHDDWVDIHKSLIHARSAAITDVQTAIESYRGKR